MSPGRVVLPLALAVFLLALPAASAGHGPLPTTSPSFDAVETAQDNTATSMDVLTAYGFNSHQQVSEAIETIQQGVVEEQDVIVPMDQLDQLIDGSNGALTDLVTLAHSSGTAILQGTQGQEGEVDDFQALMSTTLTNALGVDPEHPYRALTETSPPCVRDVQAAVDEASPGQEIRVCAGTYEGPVRIDQHFVTLVAEQGPAATVLDADGGDGFVVTGSGVTISGFRITGADGPGSAGVRIGDEGDHTGIDGMFGTTLLGNEFRYNSYGIIVHNAPGTTIALNTFWASTVRTDSTAGTAVLVDPKIWGDPVDQVEGDAHGVLLLANNFQNNARFAIERAAGVTEAGVSSPVIAAFNHYNHPLGPNVQVGDTCYGPSAPEGDPRCRDGVGAGVVTVGFAPVPY